MVLQVFSLRMLITRSFNNFFIQASKLTIYYMSWKKDTISLDDLIKFVQRIFYGIRMFCSHTEILYIRYVINLFSAKYKPN